MLGHYFELLNNLYLCCIVKHFDAIGSFFMTAEAIAFIRAWISENVTGVHAGRESELAQNCRQSARDAGHNLNGEEFFLGYPIETLIRQRINLLA